jgi:hypothetical protein
MLGICHNNNNYCAAITAISDDDIIDDPNPVVLCVTDNISAKNWTMHTCKSQSLDEPLQGSFADS